MVGFYELRTMNHGLSLGFRCGVPPRQIHDGITTVCRPLYIPAMPRIHGGTPATAVRSGSRPAPPDSRYLADQKGSGRPLRWPQMGRFLRAEGYSRRCCPPESVAAGRRPHLIPMRPAACELRPAGCPLGISYHYICTFGMKLRDMWEMMAWYLSFLLVG